MKALMTIINWQEKAVPIIDFYEGPNADCEALECWNAIKHDWSGCTMHLELDEELSRKRAQKAPVRIKMTDQIELTFCLPNNDKTWSAVLADDRAKIFALVDQRASQEGTCLTLTYTLKITKQAVNALENSDWLWLLERASHVPTGET